MTSGPVLVVVDISSESEEEELSWTLALDRVDLVFLADLVLGRGAVADFFERVERVLMLQRLEVNFYLKKFKKEDRKIEN